jgi:hypothetical protein
MNPCHRSLSSYRGVIISPCAQFLGGDEVVTTIMPYFERWFPGYFSWLEVGSSYPLSKARSILFFQLNPHLIPSSPQNYPIVVMPQLLYNGGHSWVKGEEELQSIILLIL